MNEKVFQDEVLWSNSLIYKVVLTRGEDKYQHIKSTTDKGLSASSSGEKTEIANEADDMKSCFAPLQGAGR